LENTLGGTVVWSRDTSGQYKATLNGVFTLNKTSVLISSGVPNGAIVSAFGFDVNSVSAKVRQDSGALVDDSLAKTSIEIKVYN
jgi:hypothetical protein